MQRNADSYYDNINLPLFETIPPDAGLLLEVGCGAGRLGAAYKERFPAARYYGLEIDAPSAAIAAERLDFVMCGPAEGFNLDFLKGQVDCIVYGDVLEHLVDPWAFVKRQAELLAPDGQMVASIPNVQNFSLMLGLMRGEWAYQDAGLLDRTHLRFFTLGSIVQMFEGAGLHVNHIAGFNIDTNPPTADIFVEKISGVVADFGGNVDAFREQCKVFQYMVRASRK